MNALPETTNMSRIMYREWFPQIVYNHHQTGPGGSVMFAPPFRDPFNYNFHPGIAAATDLIGAIMQTRFIEEGKPGVVSQKGASYSTWWNGGVRTTAYFHNQIGILTETIGSPTPGSIQFSDRFARTGEQLVLADQTAAGVALPAVDRLLDHGQPCGARLRVALPRGEPLPHLPDGRGQHPVGQ